MKNDIFISILVFIGASVFVSGIAICFYLINSIVNYRVEHFIQLAPLISLSLMGLLLAIIGRSFGYLEYYVKHSNSKIK